MVVKPFVCYVIHMYDVTSRRFRATICCRVKAVSIVYSECVFVALGIQHATLMRRLIPSSVACPALRYFCTLSHKRHDFREKNVIEYEMCILLFSIAFPETFSTLRRTERDDRKCILAL